MDPKKARVLIVMLAALLLLAGAGVTYAGTGASDTSTVDRGGLQIGENDDGEEPGDTDEPGDSDGPGDTED
ncbi:MAG: hypothetical protein M3N45_12840 [Actinomycetota bacterium]|nr:hypothetical protein [Actinomycetota bacterium]